MPIPLRRDNFGPRIEYLQNVHHSIYSINNYYKEQDHHQGVYLAPTRQLLVCVVDGEGGEEGKP